MRKLDDEAALSYSIARDRTHRRPEPADGSEPEPVDGSDGGVVVEVDEDVERTTEDGRARKGPFRLVLGDRGATLPLPPLRPGLPESQSSGPLPIY